MLSIVFLKISKYAFIFTENISPCFKYHIKSKISLREINGFFYCLEENQWRCEESNPLLLQFGMNTFK